MYLHIVLRDTATIVLVSENDKPEMSVWIDDAAMIFDKNEKLILLNPADQIAINAGLGEIIRKNVTHVRSVYESSHYCIVRDPDVDIALRNFAQNI